MRNVAIIIVGVLLAAAIAFGIVFYRKYVDMKETVQTRETTISGLNAQVEQLNKERSKLREQMRTSAECFEQLEGTKARLANLESALGQKEQALVDLEVKVNRLEKDFKETKQTEESLRTELSSSQARVAELKKELGESGARVAGLEAQVTEEQRRLEKLNRQMADVQKERDAAEAALDQAQSANEATISDLNRRIESRNSTITELQKKLKDTQFQIASIKEKQTGRQDEVKQLRNQLSDLEKRKSKAEAAAEQMRLTYDPMISELKEKVRSREILADQLQNELKKAQSQISAVRDELAKSQTELETLRQHVAELSGVKTQLQGTIGELKSTYDTMAADFKKQIQNKEVTIKALEEKLSITFVDRIVFEFGKADITPEGIQMLAKVGKTLQNLQGQRFRVVGHADNIPIRSEYQHMFPSNWELSAARAAAVVRYFQEECGIDPKDLEAVGRSFYEPIASNTTEEGRAQNRRVEIIVAPKID